MRIAYVLNSLGVGGTERQVLSLAGRMAARGHAVTLLVLRGSGPEDWTTSHEVMRLNMRKTPWSFFSGLRHGVEHWRRFRPDVVHSHNFHGNILARLMRVVCPAPKLIATIHNVYEGGWPRMISYRLTDGWSCVTTAVCAAAAQRYVRMKAVPRRKCVVLTNGIEVGGFMPDAGRRTAMRGQMGVADEFVWLAAGRVTAAKDFPNLMQAFGKVWSASPRTRLWMAGGAGVGERKPEYSAFCTVHGAMNCVRSLGVRDDMAALLDAADGFVLSSAWEGMPLALGEAMAMGKPVVATDVGGVRELVGEAGVLVAAKQAETLAEGMLSVMLRSPEQREAMGRAARERISKDFSMDAKADEWERLYRSVIG
ncbi:MAG TPA: glycosyltransferase [Terracidiphilus sp.]|jgi:glycosyltransferase involved in cell wall biosynthesis